MRLYDYWQLKWDWKWRKDHKNMTNRSRHRHVHKYTKYKIYFIIMTVICIKQHLSNILNSFHEKIKQHWDWVKKNALLISEPAVQSSSSENLLWKDAANLLENTHAEVRFQ